MNLQNIQTAIKSLGAERDPVDWARAALGIDTIDEAQAAILRATDPLGSRLLVEACNGPGKTFTIAVAALRHLEKYRPSIVVTMSGGYRQMKTQLWKEIRIKAAQLKNARHPEWTIAPKSPRIETGKEDWFMLGFAADDVDTIEGWHSPHLLFIVDEAKAIKEELWNGIDSTLTDDRNKLLIVTVPGAPNTEPHTRIHDGNVQHIRIIPRQIAKEQNIAQAPGLYFSDRVSSTWLETYKTHYGPESAIYKQRVLALAVQATENPYFRDEIIKSLFSNWREFKGMGDGLAIDWAQKHDYTAVTEWKSQFGKMFRNAQGEVMHVQRDYMKIIGDIAYAHDHHPYKGFKWMIADEGEGRGQIDRMREIGLPVKGFNFGARTNGAPNKLLIMSTLKSAMELNLGKPLTIGFEHQQMVEDELNTFESVPSSSGNYMKFEAAQGSWDDCICSIAMGYWRSMGQTRIDNAGSAITVSHTHEIPVADLYMNSDGQQRQNNTDDVNSW